MVKIGYLVFLVWFGNLSKAELSDEAKLNVIGKIKKNFEASLAKIAETNEGLKLFQTDLILDRNPECQVEDSLDFNEIKLKQNFTNILANFSNEDELVSSLDKLVQIK